MRHIGVLIFIDQDIFEAPLILRQHIGLGGEDREIVHQEIAEIGGVHGPQPLLILAVELGRLAIGELGPVRGGDLLRPEAAILPALDDDREGARRPALLVDIRRANELLEEAHLIVAVENGEIRLEADQLRMATQDARRHGVEGAEPEPLRRAADELGDALDHLARRLVGEGDGEDFAREGLALVQDMGEAGGQHPGLAGAGAGEHQHRAIGCRHRRALLFVERRQIGGLGRGSLRFGGAFSHRGGKVERVTHGPVASRIVNREYSIPGLTSHAAKSKKALPA